MSSMKIVIAILAMLNGGDSLDKKEVLCLSKAIYYEARSEPAESQMAISSFMHQFARRNGTTICEEIYESRGLRYPWTLNENMNLHNIVEREAFEKAVLIATLTIQERVKYDVGDATHFLMPYIMKKMPKWYDPDLVVYKTGVIEFLRLPDYK